MREISNRFKKLLAESETSTNRIHLIVSTTPVYTSTINLNQLESVEENIQASQSNHIHKGENQNV